MNTTLNTTTTKAASGLASIVMVALIGAALVFVAGFANSAVLHDAAHDTRHSTGFPCH
jgi:cobalt transporter subunit CbtB